MTQAGDERTAADAEPPLALMALERRRWTTGWRRIVFPSVFLAYLGVTLNGIAQRSSGASSVVAYVALGIFCAAYVSIVWAAWRPDGSRFWLPYGLMIAAWIAVLPAARQDAQTMLVFVCVVTIAALPRHALPIVVVITVVATALPTLVPSWHAGVDTDAAVSIPLVSLSMFAFFGIIRSNRALMDARAEVARLAAENERTRIARDLHDLLGHSLTTIALKASLAERLADGDPARAKAEIGEVAQLARGSLAEVRDAVVGYRDVTVAGELATAGEVLRAAGLAADLPENCAVDADVDELFGWVVREALTNVVRHAAATRCSVGLTPRSIVVADDGVGGGGGSGSGLHGLAERVEARGGRFRAGPQPGGGWAVEVEVPAAGDERSRTLRAVQEPA